MPSVDFNKVEKFGLSLHHGRFNFNHSGGHTFKIALTNTAPDLTTVEVLADVADQISLTNLLSAGAVTITSSSQTGGLYKVVFADFDIEASGGSLAAWRYVVLYDDTASGDPVVGVWDYGSSKTLLEGDLVPFNLDQTDGLFDYQAAA